MKDRPLMTVVGRRGIENLVAEEFPNLSFTSIDCRGVFISIDDFRYLLKQVLDREILQDAFKVLRKPGIPRATISYYIDMPYETHRGRYKFEVRNRHTTKFGGGDYSAHIYKLDSQDTTITEQVAISNIGVGGK